MWPYLLGPKSVEKFPNQETKYILFLSVLLVSVTDVKSRQTINMVLVQTQH